MNRVAFIVTALLVSSPAWAAGGGDGGIPMTEIGIHAVNFVLMYGLLFFLLRKPIGELLRQRQASIRQDLEDASGAKNEAQDRLDAIQAKLFGTKASSGGNILVVTIKSFSEPRGQLGRQALYEKNPYQRPQLRVP